MICRYKPYTEQWIGKIIDPMDLPMGYLAKIIKWITMRNWENRFIAKDSPRSFYISKDENGKELGGHWTLDESPFWKRNDGQCKVQIIRKLDP